jgi:DNA polymerase (family 10)
MANKNYLPLKDALELAGVIESVLLANGVSLLTCGSIRRRKDPVGDIDIVVNIPAIEAAELIKSHTIIPAAFAGGEKKADIFIHVDKFVDPIQVNLYYAEPEHWGAMTLFLTGSKWFNIRMRKKAKDQGLKLSQYGLFFRAECLAREHEIDIFKVLDMEWKSPEDRE